MRELTIIIIPATVLNVGYSPGSIIQLSTAPNIGLINLHILISLTLAPLLCKAIKGRSILAMVLIRAAAVQSNCGMFSRKKG